MTLYFVFINFSLSTFILFLNVSPPSIVWCTYVGNYYCPAIDECQWPAPMSIGPRGPGADRSEWCMVGDVVFAFLSGLSLQLQQWQFAAAWDSSNTFVARVAQSVFADPISQLSWSLEIAVWNFNLHLIIYISTNKQISKLLTNFYLTLCFKRTN